MQTNSTDVPKDVDKFCFYNDPRAQMDGGTKCSVTNIIDILHNVTWFNKRNPSIVCMRGATSGKIIIPSAKGWLSIQANTKDGFIDVLCYYSPHFTSTLLSEQDVLQSSQFAKELSGQVMTNYFELNNNKVNKDLSSKNYVDLDLYSDYQMDYGSCTFSFVHHKLKRKNIEIPGFI